jgi:phosphate-selective porin OprO/OprP
MKRYMGLKSVLIASIALLGLNGMVRPGLAVPVEVKSETDTFNVDGRFQLLGTLEHLDDPYNDSDRLYLFLKQARLNFNGQVKQCEYALQLMFGGEEVPERNSVMSLLDAYVDVPISEDAFRVKIGQFKVPYSRERLFDSGDFLHVDRSINNAYFNLGRDVGVAAHGSAGQLTGAAGIPARGSGSAHAGDAVRR